MTDIVEIETVGARGDGVAEAGALFVPGTLPGERVRIARHGQRGQVLEVLSPSLERIEPVCRHFGRCGGCSLQHASPAFLADWKRGLVAAALAARGFGDVEIRPTIAVPAASRRRITVTARRTKKATAIGFHMAGSETIVDLQECPVARPALAAAVPRLAELVGALASRKGELRITLTDSAAGVDCAVEGARPLDGPAQALMAGIATRAGLVRIGVDGEAVVTRAAPVQPIGRASVLPPPGAFMQPTAEGEAAMLAAVRAALEVPGGQARRVLDLFAGVGTFTLPLAEGAEVVAFEIEAAALAALDRGWREAAGQGLQRVATHARNLFHRPLAGPELKGAEAVVIDPPRAGAREQATQLAASPVPVIASVSCNPATFARDARILVEGGYRLDWVQPIDQFLWSGHVELVARLSRP
ncbi:MAG: class I SAM-dependent RNA methyltransferase [Pseudomonadota bacterium]